MAKTTSQFRRPNRRFAINPDFTTKRGGSGAVAVGDFIQFADPDHLIGFEIVREATAERWLTGGDIDPESLQRDRRGDLWVGDEFGPWIHTRSQIRYLGPALAGRTFTYHGQLVDAYERRGHHYAVLDIFCQDDTGQPVTQVRHTAIYKLRQN